MYVSFPWTPRVTFFVIIIGHHLCTFSQKKGGDAGNVNFAAILVHKLVSVLESIEKLPVYLYESPGSCFGLQVSENCALSAFFEVNVF